MVIYTPLNEWIREKHLTAPNTLAFIKDLEADCEELSKNLGVQVRLMVES